MTTDKWLSKSAFRLKSAGLGTARLDILVLLEDVTGKDRGWLLAHPETEISADQETELEKLLKLRARHMPLSYIRGKTEFYGREFVLTPAVLEPRPETETMIDCLKDLYRNSPASKSGAMRWRIADVGTGSGALGITAALEIPGSQVDLLDVDLQALKVAKTNVDRFTLNISVIESDLLSKAHKDYDVLLCNLPYVPDDYRINRSAMHEPALAIYGGTDGLDLYRRLYQQITALNKQPLYILTESLPFQHPELQAVAEKSGYQVVKKDDFIQVFFRAN